MGLRLGLTYRTIASRWLQQEELVLRQAKEGTTEWQVSHWPTGKSKKKLFLYSPLNDPTHLVAEDIDAVLAKARQRVTSLRSFRITSVSNASDGERESEAEGDGDGSDDSDGSRDDDDDDDGGNSNEKEEEDKEKKRVAADRAATTTDEDSTNEDADGGRARNVARSKDMSCDANADSSFAANSDAQSGAPAYRSIVLPIDDKPCYEAALTDEALKSLMDGCIIKLHKLADMGSLGCIHIYYRSDSITKGLPVNPRCNRWKYHRKVIPGLRGVCALQLVDSDKRTVDIPLEITADNWKQMVRASQGVTLE